MGNNPRVYFEAVSLADMVLSILMTTRTKKTKKNKKKLKPLVIAIFALVLSGIVSLVVLLNVVTKNLEQQTAEFGSAIASQLAITLTENMVQQDILSLNVLLAELVGRQYFEFASVYSVDNRLLAQAGERKINTSYRTFTADIPFQDEIAGYVEVGVSSTVNDATVIQGLIYLVTANLLLIAVAVLFWIKPIKISKRIPLTLISLCKPLFRTPGNPGTGVVPDHIGKDGTGVDNMQLVIVVKIGPGSLVGKYTDWIKRSVNLYSGELLSRRSGEFTLLFSGANHSFDGVCCAWLLITLCQQDSLPVEFKAGAQLVSTGELEVCRKYASYLASVSSNSILLSKEVSADMASRTGIELLKYHNSAVSDDQVYIIRSLDSTLIELIERQIYQLRQSIKL